MLNEQVCEQKAKLYLEDYVNGCKCDSRDEAKLAVQKMIAVATHALGLLEVGHMATVQ